MTQDVTEAVALTIYMHKRSRQRRMRLLKKRTEGERLRPLWGVGFLAGQQCCMRLLNSVTSS